MNNCIFCTLLQDKDPAIFYQEPLFMAMWSSLPAVPGHALVIPKRHLQRFGDMNNAEMRRIAFAVAAVKTQIKQADLKTVCANLEIISDTSRERIARALEQLKGYNYEPPKAFNDGMNDGPEAGQTIPHLHWHILPRWGNTVGAGADGTQTDSAAGMQSIGDAESGIVERFTHQAHTL